MDDGSSNAPTESAVVDGSLVDGSLIDAMWALSPEERLRQNDRMVRTILLLRQGFEAMKAAQDGGER
jgi:hypothetical protein